ncbi:MAG: hypothetical protein ABIB46_06330 [bacterium]
MNMIWDKINVKNLMINNLVIEIGNIGIEIQCEDKVFLNLIKEKYKNFLSNKKPKYLIILLLKKKIGKKIDGVKVSYLENKIIIERYGLYSEIDLKKQIITITQIKIFQNFDAFLRIFFSLILVEKNGFLLHASSIIKDNKAFVFTGKSEAGKSTIVKLSPECTLLSEEVSLIKQVRNRFYVYGTPFFGELGICGINKKAELYKIFTLQKAKQNFIKKIKNKESIEKLMSNILFFSNNALISKNLFNLCFKFLKKHSLQELHFTLDNSFWKTINA